MPDDDNTLIVYPEKDGVHYYEWVPDEYPFEDDLEYFDPQEPEWVREANDYYGEYLTENDPGPFY